MCACQGQSGMAVGRKVRGQKLVLYSIAYRQEHNCYCVQTRCSEEALKGVQLNIEPYKLVLPAFNIDAKLSKQYIDSVSLVANI